jgi:formylglycine-generating enzyme required for sulfatase activity/energy-coupling factor transporter ATP-binding protein EcfA2
MSDLTDPKLEVQLELLKQLHDEKLLSDEAYTAKIRELGIDPNTILDLRGARIDKQFNVARDYIVHNAPAHASSPTLDADTALARYLNHVIESNRRLQLQGIRSSTGLVSIELEEIYITLTTTERRTIKDEEQWLHEMRHLAPGEALRMEKIQSRESMQQVKVKVQEALRDHSRLVILGDPGSGKTTLLKYLALTFARDPKRETGLVEMRLQLNESRLPILLPLRDFAKHLQEKHKDASVDGPKPLLDYLHIYFENQDIKLPDRFFADMLTAGKCAILLDGVDEVADLPTRQRIARIIEKFTIVYPDNRYIVTSRIVGYADAARLGEKYEVTTIRDFNWENITSFVGYWNRAIEIILAGAETEYALQQAQVRSKELLDAIKGNERVRELAVNPLMLTVIALVQRYRTQLSERRVELYEEAIEVLLSHWDEAKGLSSTMMIAGRELDAGDRRSLLEPVALWMMEQHIREIEADELGRQLRQRFKGMLNDDIQARKATEAFLKLINERSGLLAERGQGIYAFSHLTFQEHLAARAVSDKADFIAYTLQRLDDSWWREVILLETGYLGTQGKQRASDLIQAIMDHSKEDEPYHNLVLAAECLHDLGQVRVTSGLFQEVQRRLRKELEASLRLPGEKEKHGEQSADVPILIRRRADVADALGQIENGTYSAQPAFWRLPYGEPVWINIPGGEFWMGGNGQYDGKPVHRVNVPTFQIAKTPITNTQYRFFVDATGHKSPEHWGDGKVPRGVENHPVVNVSWYDALEYCYWLSQVMQKSIALPSEAQWEKAARGAFASIASETELDGVRAYPWGNDWDPTKCNNGELGLNETTPVGIFHDGKSPYGCLDMSGNVWEWTTTIWGPYDENKREAILKYPYPYNVEDGREDLTVGNDMARVLRGGSFSDGHVGVRCAFHGGVRPTSHYRGDGFRVVVIDNKK